MKEEKKYLFWMLHGNDRNKIIVLLSILGFYNIVLGLVNFTYIDDASRQISGDTGFATSYSRWGSEITSWIIQGNKHLVDMGLFNHLLSSLILAISCLIVVYSLNRRLTWMSMLSSIFICLNPWFLQNLSFRFDTVFMSLSILFSVIPYIFWRTEKFFYLFSFISIFLMCNYYQASSSIYVLTFLIFSLRDLLNREKFLKILKKSLISSLIYILIMLIYKEESKYAAYISQKPQVVELAKNDRIWNTVYSNFLSYYKVLYEQSSKLWVTLFILVILLFIFSCIYTSNINKFISLIYIYIYISISIFFSYGVLLAFNTFWAGQNPRYSYGFSYFIALLLIYVSDLKIENLKFINNFVVGVFLFYFLSFPFCYFTSLDKQKESFEYQANYLLTIIKPFLSDNRRVIYMDYLFKNSPVVLNNEKNFPILAKLVPSNEEIYWPNVQILNTIGQIHIDIYEKKTEHMDFSGSEFQNIRDDVDYLIYINDNEIFIKHK